MATCCCLGPQNGEPLCPCQMRAARGYLGGADAADLMSPYKPTVVHFDHAGMTEYVSRDVPTIVERVDDVMSLHRDMETREIIGVQLHPRHPNRNET